MIYLTTGKSCYTGYLVTSSRVQPMATTAVARLHLAHSLGSHLILLREGPFKLFTLSSHLVLGHPRLLFPLISPSITSFSIPRSSLTTCPKYLKLLVSPFCVSLYHIIRLWLPMLLETRSSLPAPRFPHPLSPLQYLR